MWHRIRTCSELHFKTMALIVHIWNHSNEQTVWCRFNLCHLIDMTKSSNMFWSWIWTIVNLSEINSINLSLYFNKMFHNCRKYEKKVQSCYYYVAYWNIVKITASRNFHIEISYVQINCRTTCYLDDVIALHICHVFFSVTIIIIQISVHLNMNSSEAFRIIELIIMVFKDVIPCNW